VPVRVLLVDDEPMFLAALHALLDRDRRIDVVGSADNGRTAIELARRMKPDVVLVDLAMPGVDGFEVTRHVVSSDSSARVVAVSGLSHDDDVEKARAAGATAFLLKGGLEDEIADAIVAASESGQALA